MLDMLKKTMFTGLGLVALTKEKIEEHVNDLVKKGKLSEKEGKEFITELLKKSETAGEEIKDQLEKSIADVLKKMNLVFSNGIKLRIDLNRTIFF